MGKTAKIKGDLDDVEAILEIISILKDVSTNRFFTFAQQKDDFGKFLELFLIFFNMLESVETDCPLVRNNYPGMDLVVITSESSFMAQLNSKVCSAAMKELEKNPNAQVVCVGYRGADRMRSLGIKLAKVYENIEKIGRYQAALAVRDHLIDRIMSGESGKATCVYVWAKSFNILKPRSVKLLPAEELLAAPEEEGGSGGGTLAAKRQKFIAESSIDGLMKVLADIWVSCRLFEMISDSLLAEAAAQAQQLESAMEGLSKEKKGLVLGFKKASRGDLNKAMREVFTSSKICRKR
ncbi:MAG: F0F1 ATP synthase subunit gamma [Candidatus Omnitrophica bacterium]|nr:F0F1 ATP synthase subunit gamma [Candidatus Omnitrophota bacterium]